MTGISRHVMRLVLLILVAQFVAAVSLSIASSHDGDLHRNQYSVQFLCDSIPAPLLLKEKEETDTGNKKLSLVRFALIDFSDLPLLIKKSHTTNLKSIGFNNRIDHHPPLYALYAAFLI